jgi:hypothetical protein
VGHSTIDTLIRNTKNKGDVTVMKNTTLESRSEMIKKQSKDVDRVMKELLDQDQKEKTTTDVATGSQKKSNTRKTGGHGTSSDCKTMPCARGGM